MHRCDVQLKCGLRAWRDRGVDGLVSLVVQISPSTDRQFLQDCQKFLDVKPDKLPGNSYILRNVFISQLSVFLETNPPYIVLVEGGLILSPLK